MSAYHIPLRNHPAGVALNLLLICGGIITATRLLSSKGQAAIYAILLILTFAVIFSYPVVSMYDQIMPIWRRFRMRLRLKDVFRRAVKEASGINNRVALSHLANLLEEDKYMMVVKWVKDKDRTTEEVNDAVACIAVLQDMTLDGEKLTGSGLFHLHQGAGARHIGSTVKRLDKSESSRFETDDPDSDDEMESNYGSMRSRRSKYGSSRYGSDKSGISAFDVDKAESKMDFVYGSEAITHGHHVMEDPALLRKFFLAGGGNSTVRDKMEFFAFEGAALDRAIMAWVLERLREHEEELPDLISGASTRVTETGSIGSRFAEDLRVDSMTDQNNSPSTVLPGEISENVGGSLPDGQTMADGADARSLAQTSRTLGLSGTALV